MPEEEKQLELKNDFSKTEKNNNDYASLEKHHMPIANHTAPEGFKNVIAEPVQKNNFMKETLSFEQKQLLVLEKQQKELQLRLLKMQQEFAPKEQLNFTIKKGGEIQKEQEEVIKQIVLKSAVFEKEKMTAEGCYKEEFIQSICMKSGVFVKEFREVVDDPYARNEFIMSISMQPAQFRKVL